MIFFRCSSFFRNINFIRKLIDYIFMIDVSNIVFINLPQNKVPKMFMYSNVCTRVNVYLMVLVFIFLFYLWKISSCILMHLNCIHLIICYSGRFKVSGFSTLCFFILFQYQSLGLFSLLSKWAWFHFFITFYTCILI